MLVISDELKVRQILLNLVGNAVKFTKQGLVTVSVESSADEFTLIVVDTGCGMTADETELAFGEFQQVGQADNIKPAGTGLGLSIARSLAGLLGGRLECESDPGVGSTFRAVMKRHA